MLTIRPLAAALNPPEQVAAAVARAGELLARRGVAHRFVTAEGDAADALLIVTGGSEHLALAAAERIDGPVFLLAHAGLNSLPAALEVLACLRQRGRPGRILPLEDGDPALPRLARHQPVGRGADPAEARGVQAPPQVEVTGEAGERRVAVLEREDPPRPPALAQAGEDLERGRERVEPGVCE